MAKEILREAAGRRVVDEDGDEITIELLPPCTIEEIAELEATIPCPLPHDAYELLSFARGFEGGPMESVDFSGLTDPIFEEILPCGLPIAHDGFGNYWVLDLTSQSPVWGPILYVCHDPPVIVYQCADVGRFIADTLDLAEEPYESPIDDVHERHVLTIWRDNPGAVPQEQALASSDDVIRNFARELTVDHFIVDMRDASTGDGFSWGRFGPRTPVVRAGEARVFAYQSTGRRAWLRRLFGR